MTTTLLTLAEVLADFTSIDEADSCGLALVDIKRTQGEDEAAVTAWAWVQGLTEPGSEWAAAGSLLGEQGGPAGDTGFYLAMHSPVAEALRWWRCMDWENMVGDYGGPLDPDLEVWAWGVLGRLRALAVSLGPTMARQVSVVEAVRRTLQAGAAQI